MIDIKEYNISTSPGIYVMKKDNKVIYVGKAKNLKRRVESYFNRVHNDGKTRRLVEQVEKIETILCNSELDALILENNLIKKYKPKYNILLKDEKTYPYLKISKEEFPKVGIIRTTKKLDSRRGHYYGPYPSGSLELKKLVVKVFKVRDCNRDMEKVYKKPCLRYYMRSCDGPCVYKEVKLKYQEQVERAKEFLGGRGREVVKKLKKEMEALAKEMRFEEAIIYKERIRKIENASTFKVVDSKSTVNEDVFVYKEIGKKVFWCVLTIVDGKILGKNMSKIDIEDKIYDNLTQELIKSYYQKHIIPRDITIESGEKSEYTDLVEWLSYVKKAKVVINIPKIKSRRMELVEMAKLNLEKGVEDYYNKKASLEKGMADLYEVLGLRNYPRRIECFDISNIQGKDAVGSMSVAVEGKQAKKEYRKFKIKSKDTPDDFHMMKEVMERRYTKLKENEYPDLILIDGGLGQLSSVTKVIEGLNLADKIDIISIAKREEEIFKSGEKTPYIFPKEDEALKILQRLRDEAHRFGVTYHRKLRSKRVVSSKLDNYKGIGKVKKEKLLKRFGSVKRIKEATLEELMEVVPEEIAKKLRE